MKIPIISIITETVAAAKKRGCKKVGVLATTGLIHSGLYQGELIEAGISALEPEEQDQRDLMDQILRFKDTGESEGLRNIVRSISDKLILSGADGMILGCTEIPVVVSQQDCRIPFFDTIEILALAAIREARA